MVVFSPVAQQPSSGIEDILQAIHEILRRADQQTVRTVPQCFALPCRYNTRVDVLITCRRLVAFVLSTVRRR